MLLQHQPFHVAVVADAGSGPRMGFYCSALPLPHPCSTYALSCLFALYNGSVASSWSRIEFLSLWGTLLVRHGLLPWWRKSFELRNEACFFLTLQLCSCKHVKMWRGHKMKCLWWWAFRNLCLCQAMVWTRLQTKRCGTDARAPSRWQLRWSNWFSETGICMNLNTVHMYVCNVM